MCGLAGVLSRDDGRPVERRRLEAMIEVLHHRGPDATGYHTEPFVGLGFCRLSIVDLAGGDQPLCNEDGSVWLVFNGEIYNHQALSQELRGKGHAFRSRGDSEAIVHAYEEWGEECVDHLRGIFAFAIWDRRQRRLLLARDHSGIKPLYVTETATEIVFASEAKALLVDQPSTRALDLAGYSLRDEPDALFDRSLFRGVRSVGPGCVFVADERGPRARRYWSYAPTDQLEDGRSAEAIVERFRCELDRSVREQVMSDVPIGAYLSGGVDSSAVVACMARMDPKMFETLTSVNHAVGEDAKFARMCVDALGLRRAHFYDADFHAAAVALLPLMAWMSEGEFDAAFLSRYQLARCAQSRGIKVILTGQGIDEILTGYFHSFDTFVQTRAEYRLATYGGVTYRGYPPFRRELLTAILAAQEGRSTEECATRETVAALRASHRDLTRGLLRFEDSMGMAASVEVRVPLLDHQLLELCAGIPQRRREELFSGKALLRRAARPWLPEALVERPKFAFNSALPPLSRLIELGAAGDSIRSLITDEAVAAKGYFDPALVRGLRAGRNYPALDHVLLVQLLDDVFVSRFDSGRFRQQPPLDAVLPSGRPHGAVVPVPSGLSTHDVPRLHPSLAAVSAEQVFDAAAGRLATGKARVSFVEGQRPPVGVSMDVIPVLSLIDGARSYAEIAEELEDIEVTELLAFCQRLIDLGIIASAPR
jgi:asparagine synthase (glutamine-hydrolysing)